MAGLSKTKTKPNPKLKFELKFGAELCKRSIVEKINAKESAIGKRKLEAKSTRKLEENLKSVSENCWGMVM